MDILIRLLIILFTLVFGAQTSTVPPTPDPETTRQSPTQITDVQAVILTSFPAQINLTITGYQPDGCGFPVQVEQHREGNTVTVNICRIMPMSVMCPMVVLPYDESIHLDGSFESGTYTIHVNDFTLEVTV